MTRFERLQLFINTHFSEQQCALAAITADASFRRYYRLNCANNSFIVMDSDPLKVNNAPYISLNSVFTQQGFLLPAIIASDEQQGFFILSDLGSTHLADMLDDEHRTEYYQQLIKLSVQWAKTPAAAAMQAYDKKFIAVELGIFSQWLMHDFIDCKLTAEQQMLWQTSCDLLSNTMLAQPSVTMHRDYHSRNIMRCNQQWAIIDYQDAVRGPLCYDLVSLLRDCYFKLPESELTHLVKYGYDEFNRQGLIANVTFNEFNYWFDLTGLQRHLKAAGIFCRLYLRDGKKGYLANILPTLAYIVEVAANYSELQALGLFIQNTIAPKVVERLAKERT
ncbi:phosphotransferase [Pseudoalteromonas nigrifaciens]|uniref:aminoglycoside phosphotransferase family protein n=1 Tax=Pseudoalteromonas nigrifaciens TaxID=28109 RepID=UPI0017888468|nr:phosphotransferase [Pseudoalteromonas nigrifaciens]MBE0419846.1 phosphotransferase [Pseudoalteromonas nigrifaciens]